MLYTRPFSSNVDPTEYLKNPDFTYEQGFEDGSSRVVLVIEDKNLQSVITIVHDHSKSWWDKLISADLFSSPVQVTERPISYNEYDNPIYGNATYLSTPWGGGSAKVYKSATESELQKLLPDIKKAQYNVDTWGRRLEKARTNSPQDVTKFEKDVQYWTNELAKLEVQRQALEAQIEAEKK